MERGSAVHTAERKLKKRIRTTNCTVEKREARFRKRSGDAGAYPDAGGRQAGRWRAQRRRRLCEDERTTEGDESGVVGVVIVEDCAL
jgi:hypothetical protein